MGKLLAAAAIATALATVPWRPYARADLAAKGAWVEQWEVRAVSPDGRRAFIVRYTRLTIEWLVFDLRVRESTWGPSRIVAHGADNVRMKGDFGDGAIVWNGGTVRVEARDSFAQAESLLRFSTEGGAAIGPLHASARPVTLAVVSGRVSGSIRARSLHFELRSWRAALVHEWMNALVDPPPRTLRRDLVTVWRPDGRLRAVWGYDAVPHESTEDADDRRWQGALVDVGGRTTTCGARVAHRELFSGMSWRGPQLARRLDVRCGGRAFAVTYTPGWLAYSHFVASGLAQTSDGYVGLYDQYDR